MVIANTILSCLNSSVSLLGMWLSGRTLVCQMCGTGFDTPRDINNSEKMNKWFWSQNRVYQRKLINVPNNVAGTAVWGHQRAAQPCLALNHIVSKDCLTSEDPVARSMVSGDGWEEMKRQSLLPLTYVSQHFLQASDREGLCHKLSHSAKLLKA